MKLIHWILGKLILLFDAVFRPKAIERSPQAQAAIDEQTRYLKLYQYQACPFCVKVRRALHRQALNIDTRDVKRCASAKEELLAGGGKLKVPCLRIDNGAGETQWMYESSDIIHYLQKRFATDAKHP